MTGICMSIRMKSKGSGSAGRCEGESLLVSAVSSAGEFTYAPYFSF